MTSEFLSSSSFFFSLGLILMQLLFQLFSYLPRFSHACYKHEDFVWYTEICMNFRNVTIKRVKRHHHHMSVMELGHLLTRSDLTYLEVSSEVCHGSFCQLGIVFHYPG